SGKRGRTVSDPDVPVNRAGFRVIPDVHDQAGDGTTASAPQAGSQSWRGRESRAGGANASRVDMPGGMSLSRRHFLALSAALAQTSVPKQLRPRALRPGDTVGLITPSSYVSDPDRLALAEHTLKYFD